MHYDVIVLGLGSTGSATAAALAARGRTVLGLDRHHPPHDFGSAHGRSRIIRKSYMEDPAYVPLLHRAYDLWRELERDTGTSVLRITGGLMIGAEDSGAVAGSLASAREHELAHTLLTGAEIRRRFPALATGDDVMGLYEDAAGVLVPETCIELYLQLCRDRGVDLRPGTPVLGFDVTPTGVSVTTSRGAHTAEQLVITAGAWAPDLLDDLRVPLRVTRQVMHWFRPLEHPERFAPDRFPIYIWEPDAGDVFYGFPALDGTDDGVKVAIHELGEECSPDTIDREVRAADVDAVRACLSERLPSLNGEHLAAATCMYTNTPDRHFLLGRHPDSDRVALAAGLSGHGFKFSSVIGEILADLVTAGGTPLPITPFAPGRFR